MGLPCARLLLLGHVDHVTTGQQHLSSKLLHLITKTDKENSKGKTCERKVKLLALAILCMSEQNVKAGDENKIKC